MCCAELELHEQGCQAPAANRDSQEAEGACVEQERVSVTEHSWSLQKPLSNQGHSSQPSLGGEKKQPARSITSERTVKDDHDHVCFHDIHQLIFLIFT